MFGSSYGPQLATHCLSFQLHGLRAYVAYLDNYFTPSLLRLAVGRCLCQGKIVSQYFWIPGGGLRTCGRVHCRCESDPYYIDLCS